MAFLKNTMSCQNLIFLYSKFSFFFLPLFLSLPSPHFSITHLTKNKWVSSWVSSSSSPYPFTVSSLLEMAINAVFSRVWEKKEEKRDAPLVSFCALSLLFLGKEKTLGEKRKNLFSCKVWYFFYSVGAKTKFWLLGYLVPVVT